MAKTPSLLIDIASRHQVYLEGHKTQIAKTFDKFLLKMSRQIERRLTRGDLTTYNRDRLEALLDSVKSDMSDQYRRYYGVWSEQIIDLAQYEAGFEARSLAQVMKHDFEIPSKTQIKSAVMSIPLHSIKGPDGGKLLKSFYRGWTDKSVDATVGVIRSGYFQGKTTPQIVREVKGTAGAGFRDGQLARGNKDITMLTRTAVQHAAAQARAETWGANADVVKGVRWVSTLDARTTAECASLDGQVFPLDSGPRPPLHPGCRSTTVAALDERYDFLREGAERKSRGESGVKDIPAKQTYYDWLKSQPAGFQDTAIGPKRGQLLREGGLSSKRFAELGLNENFESRTLDEMRKLEPLAFERAGL